MSDSSFKDYVVYALIASHLTLKYFDHKLGIGSVYSHG